MKIAIVGLGLIGGSVCKALKKNTFHHIMGLDADGEVCRKALDSGAIDEIITADGLNDADMTMLCLYPETIVEFVKQHKDRFKPGSIVTDSCGVKEYVVTRCTEVLEPLGVIFVGSHPMAGREFSGFDYSTDDLFKGASYIITPSENTPKMAIDLLSTLACCMGFGKVVTATPKQHDINIAFTSQLAHVVSNAYVKSPSLFNADGFSAGSFMDLTRVAKLNEYMWSSLFLCNKEALLFELNTIIDNLCEYRDAIGNDDIERLRDILRDGVKKRAMSFTQNTQGEKYNMPSTKKTRSYAIALSGILSAICIVLMFCTGFIPIGVYILPAVAGLVVWIIYREISRKWALLCYAAVALLALLLTPDIESKLLFTGFFGYYPVIRDLLTKIKPAVLSFLLRFICFNVPVVAIYALLLNVLGMGQLIEDFAGFGQFAVLAFWLIGNFTFVCYDVCLSQLSYVYEKWLRRKVHRLIR